jgi:hypothetical protein
MTMEIKMRFRGKQRESLEGARSTISEVRAQGSSAIGHLPKMAGQLRRGAGQLAKSLPGTVGDFQSSAGTTVTSLQKMPDSELGMLAAASIGLGAGLGAAGAPRLLALAGFAGGTILGFAMLSRPSHSPHPAKG